MDRTVRNRRICVDVYARLKEMNRELPELPPLGGIYKPALQTGSLVYVSGQGATVKGIPVITGKVGSEVTMEEGRESAVVCTMNCLSVLHAFLGDLNKVKRLVKMTGFVASAAGFNSQPQVIDAASRFLRDLYGENGVGTRLAIGTNELPGNIAVEIEYIFEV